MGAPGVNIIYGVGNMCFGRCTLYAVFSANMYLAISNL
jgi:hypothetical protein